MHCIHVTASTSHVTPHKLGGRGRSTTTPPPFGAALAPGYSTMALTSFSADGGPSLMDGPETPTQAGAPTRVVGFESRSPSSCSLNSTGSAESGPKCGKGERAQRQGSLGQLLLARAVPVEPAEPGARPQLRSINTSRGLGGRASSKGGRPLRLIGGSGAAAPLPGPSALARPGHS